MGAEEGCRFVCCCSPATTRIACSGGRRLVRCSRTLARGAATPAPKRGSRGRRPRRSAAPPSAGCEPVAATVADSLGLPFIWHLACLLHPLEKHALPGSPPPPLPPPGSLAAPATQHAGWQPQAAPPTPVAPQRAHCGRWVLTSSALMWKACCSTSWSCKLPRSRWKSLACIAGKCGRAGLPPSITGQQTVRVVVQKPCLAGCQAIK